MTEHTLSDFSYQMGVRTDPATDAYMQGLRQGTVSKIGRKYVEVMFLSLYGEISHRKFLPHNLIPE